MQSLRRLLATLATASNIERRRPRKNRFLASSFDLPLKIRYIVDDLIGDGESGFFLCCLLFVLFCYVDS